MSLESPSSLPGWALLMKSMFKTFKDHNSEAYQSYKQTEFTNPSIPDNAVCCQFFLYRIIRLLG
jgi:hypothetical protein